MSSRSTPAPDAMVSFYNHEILNRFQNVPRPIVAKVFDMDGTLADVDHLVEHYLRGDKRDFDGFHRASEFAPAHEWVVTAAKEAVAEGYAVLIVTARMSSYLGETIRWLTKNDVFHDKIYMRKFNDFRPDDHVKREIIAQIREDGYSIEHAWDDNPSIITLWKEHDVPVTEVPRRLPPAPRKETSGANLHHA